MEGPVQGPRMGLDCGLRRNDGGLGAMNRAPAKKPTLVSTLTQSVGVVVVQRRIKRIKEPLRLVT